MTCHHCGTPLEGHVRSYCDSHCYDRAYRRRRAGLPEDSYRRGGRRGPYALGVPTRTEIAFGGLLAEQLQHLTNDLKAIAQ